MNKNRILMDKILNHMWARNPYDFRFVLMMTWEEE